MTGFINYDNIIRAAYGCPDIFYDAEKITAALYCIDNNIDLLEDKRYEI